MLTLFCASLLAAFGQLLLKLGADGGHSISDFLNSRIVLGLASYSLSTIFWIWALSKAPLSVAYAFTALTFVLVYFASSWVLGERLPLVAVLGIGCVVLGFVLLALAPR
jgi:multidrug transporter EmrE-like cation transporter